jgi:hypothetical protein
VHVAPRRPPQPLCRAMVLAPVLLIAALAAAVAATGTVVTAPELLPRTQVTAGRWSDAPALSALYFERAKELAAAGTGTGTGGGGGGGHGVEAWRHLLAACELHRAAAPPLAALLQQCLRRAALIEDEWEAARRQAGQEPPQKVSCCRLLSAAQAPPRGKRGR